MKNFKQFQEGAAAMALRSGAKLGSNLLPKITAGIGAVGTLMQAKRDSLGRSKTGAKHAEDKERRRQLAKDNNLDPTNPRDRAKLGRLMKQQGDAKSRAAKGDTRPPEEYRKDKADDRKTIDAARQSMGQSKAKPGTAKRKKIDQDLDNFRKEIRGQQPDRTVPSTSEKIKLKVGQKVEKPPEAPKTGRNKPTAEKRADRKSYEAQQRRNAKEDKLSESVNIEGDFNGTLYVNSTPETPQQFEEKYTADIVWQGNLYRMDIDSKVVPSKQSLGEQIQGEYPGAIVHNIYPSDTSNNNTMRITGIKRYQPERLTWGE